MRLVLPIFMWLGLGSDNVVHLKLLTMSLDFFVAQSPLVCF